MTDPFEQADRAEAAAKAQRGMWSIFLCVRFYCLLFVCCSFAWSASARCVAGCVVPCSFVPKLAHTHSFTANAHPQRSNYSSYKRNSSACSKPPPQPQPSARASSRQQPVSLPLVWWLWRWVWLPVQVPLGRRRAAAGFGLVRPRGCCAGRWCGGRVWYARGWCWRIYTWWLGMPRTGVRLHCLLLCFALVNVCVCVSTL